MCAWRALQQRTTRPPPPPALACGAACSTTDTNWVRIRQAVYTPYTNTSVPADSTQQDILNMNTVFGIIYSNHLPMVTASASSCVWWIPRQVSFCM